MRYIYLLTLALALAACGGASPTDAPADTPADAPTTEAATAEPTVEPTAEPAEAGTRDNPVPLGQAAEVGDWTVTVLSVNPDAAADVAAENQFNDPPAAGHQFVMPRLTVTYNGADEGNFWIGTSRAVVGNAGNSFTDSCGVFPDDLTDEPEMFTGASAEGNICLSVESVQLEDATLSIEESLSFNGDRVFFALK